MAKWWNDCGSPEDSELSPRISAVQMDAITWPREASRRWLGETKPPVSNERRSFVLSNDPDLARNINDLLARFADH